MSIRIEPINRLINQFSKLPSIGGRSATRLAFHIIAMSEADVRELAEAIFYAKKLIRHCTVCGGITEADPCGICTDAMRDSSTLCVVGDARDIFAMERSREYRGKYHVLNGFISPLKGIGPDDIRLKELLERVAEGETKEVILATNPDVEGDATSAYIAQLLKRFNIKVTRIAHGVPVGGNLEYADEVTLSKAMEGRREV